MNKTKSTIGWFISVVVGISAAILPLLWAYSLWAWIIAQVPMTSEWAGLIKIGITLGMIFFGGAATVAISLSFGVLAGVAVAFIIGLVR